MAKISKFKESTGNTTTWKQLSELIKSDKVKLIRVDLDEITELADELGDKPISLKNSDITEVYDYVIVWKDSVPVAVILEYELINPFVFGDIVICPGHDSITCYNKVTGESKRSNIR